MEKIAYKIVKKEAELISVAGADLETYIGASHFSSKRYYEKTPPGVIAGLAYNEYGGSILYIEATRSSFKKEQSGGLTVTGQLGDVMKESSSIALSYAKNFLNEKMPEADAASFLDNF